MSFFAILWSIWLHRNEVVFQGKKVNVGLLIDITELRLLSWSKAKWPGIQAKGMGTLHCLSITDIPPKASINRTVTSWSKPVEGEVKFNVDGAALGKPGPAGIGGVLRDHSGNVLIKFSKSIGLADSNLAEILAIREAFKLFLSQSQLQCFALLIESDSTNAVKWVLNPQTAPWRFRNVISSIENLKLQIQRWKIIHVFREGNQFADNLAKEGIFKDEASPGT